MVAQSLDDGLHPGVAYCEAFAGHALQVRLSTGSTVEGHVADDDVLVGVEGGQPVRYHDQSAPTQPLTKVVIGLTLQQELDALGGEGPEALSGRTAEAELDGTIR